MPFVLPTFNLVINIWHGGNVPPAAPDLVTVGNLTPGRRTITPYADEPGGPQLAANMFLLLPPGTDIRDQKAASGEDLVEVPAGSFRFYTVRFVDDVGFGFANEHRLAQLVGLSGGGAPAGSWPVPFPYGTAPVPLVCGNTCATAGPAGNGILYEITTVFNGTAWVQANFLTPVPPITVRVETYGFSNPGGAVNPGCYWLIFTGACVGLSPPTNFVAQNGLSNYVTIPPFGNGVYIKIDERGGHGPTVVRVRMSYP